MTTKQGLLGVAVLTLALVLFVIGLQPDIGSVILAVTGIFFGILWIKARVPYNIMGISTSILGVYALVVGLTAMPVEIKWIFAGLLTINALVIATSTEIRKG